MAGSSGAGMISRNYRMTRFSLAVAIALVGISVSGMAQQNTTFRVKQSAPEKVPKSTVPPGGMASTPTASATNSKDLQSVERQTAKSPAPTQAKKTSAAALIPAKDEPTPANNSGGTVARKSAATTTNPDANPYRGRLRDKYDSHQSPN